MIRAPLIRTLAICAVLATLAACEDTTEGRAWYEQGDANYDALKSAHDACTAKGGQFQLKHGGDTSRIGDYECVPAKPAKGT
jgi:hypothetical protein